MRTAIALCIALAALGPATLEADAASSRAWDGAWSGVVPRRPRVGHDRWRQGAGVLSSWSVSLPHFI